MANRYPKLRKLTHYEPQALLACIDGIYIRRKWQPPSTWQVLNDLRSCFKAARKQQVAAWRGREAEPSAAAAR